MKTSDLPFEVKQGMLDQVRRHIGKESYEHMASQLGEDGLLDLVLEKSASVTAGKQESARPGCLAQALAGFLSYWWLWIPLLVAAMGGEEAGGVAWAICFGLLILGWVIGGLARMISS